MAPTKSATPPVTPAQAGPKSMALMDKGIKATLIFIRGVVMEQNRESTTSMAIRAVTSMRIIS